MAESGGFQFLEQYANDFSLSSRQVPSTSQLIMAGLFNGRLNEYTSWMLVLCWIINVMFKEYVYFGNPYLL